MTRILTTLTLALFVLSGTLTVPQADLAAATAPVPRPLRGRRAPESTSRSPKRIPDRLMTSALDAFRLLFGPDHLPKVPFKARRGPANFVGPHAPEACFAALKRNSRHANRNAEHGPKPATADFGCPTTRRSAGSGGGGPSEEIFRS